MSRIVRVAMTQCVNAYAGMPDSQDDLASLSSKLADIRQANIEHNVHLARVAKQQGVQVLCLSELFAGPYFALERRPLWRDLAEPVDGPSVSAFAAAAKDLSMVVVVPIYELDEASGSRYNAAVVVDADGTVLGKYRKTHIPGGANEQGAFFETYYYQASDQPLENGPRNVSRNPFYPVFETSVCRLGVNICYDRHFEGVVRTLVRNGAEVILSPAVTFGAKSQRLWELEFVVDATRHGVFIGGSNRKGVEAPWQQHYFGNSYFVGPNGRPDPVDVHDELVVADLDLDELSRPDPSGWALARDRRADIYDD